MSWPAVMQGGECSKPPIDGTSAGETLTGTDCRETIRGNGGDDLIYAKGGNDFVFGGTGDDQVWGEGGDDTVNGDNGNDLLDGGEGADDLTGGGGDDQLWGGPGNDELKGGSNDDELLGQAGNDQLEGGAHNDYLDGGDGNNICDGQTNDDTIVGRSGVGILRGGTGDDFIVIVGNSLAQYTVEGDTNGVAGDSDLLFFASDANPEMVSAEIQTGYPELSFELRTPLPVEISLADVIEVEAVATGDGADRLTGTHRSGDFSYPERLGTLEVHELFFSAGGNDVINTLNGDDFVDAGPGDDTVILGTGSYYLIGGEGNDTFTWSTAALAGDGLSLMDDLSAGDVMKLEGTWQIDDLSAQATSVDGQEATSLSLRGVTKWTLLGVGPDDVRIRQGRGSLWVDVLRSLPRQRSLKSGSILPMLKGKS